MASNFSSIGMPVKTEDDMYKMLIKASKNSEKIFCEHGYYSIWSSKKGGAELWVHVDKAKNEIIGINPFYNGESNYSVGIINKIEKKDYDDFEGLFYCWANPVNDNPNDGCYPFAFDCLNISAVEKKELPCIRKIRLSAFAHELRIYSDENDYNLKQTNKFHYASKSFIPSGLFPPEENDNEPFEIIPEAIFTGIILDYKKYVNELAGKKYYWIKTETYGGIIDVVADPEFIVCDLNINGVISGIFYLCGKIIE
ncbi:MAG: hypothetical protein LBP59_14650 [Planctomycetaceae bacterium]|jgi:hypothetical protein|nr:hypothetical protein [Planctomycetaceae bacterium]